MKDPCRVTPAEYEILQILWNSAQPQTVSEVVKTLQKRKSVAYTTVLTLLDKLASKESVRREKRGKAFLYRPNVPREDVLNCAIGFLSDSYFEGRRKGLIDFLSSPAKKQGLKTPEEIQADEPNLSPEDGEDIVLL